MRASAILSVEDLRKTYGTGDDKHTIIDGLSFSLRRGECYGLLGPNGAGKTTTLRLCLGLTKPDSGNVTLVGRPVPDDARAARVRVGVVPQGDNLDPDFTVSENLLVYGRYFGIADAVIRERIPRLLEFSNLTAKKDARISELSGGMRRRLTLARALVNDPDLIFMDEPTTGLDPQARHMIWERLKALLADGKTILLTTHFMDEAERLCDRLAVIDHGKMIAEGNPRDLIAAHIESQVIEAYGENALSWGESTGRRMAERYEVSGETVFCYTNDAQPLLDSLATVSGVRYIHRPANLEDLFLKMTGREMRD
ncbi:ATP-binding cassette domain-containing protein [Noviherbaspirillum suwonense]|jgi:lipooligosaccharide transport system ATP-binding protein|uniref:Lipooligosaccharide transport system ATP-binding protein n=1 Tax=Noviherbaspirillum suwonense TaxID=1224511 RepID=A0ABY1PY04_9BURK|nr:ATP-binding cassette domain-containing protein [Noviherbaspirillum suwonense]SMP52618.1 lipooligosaccharide transport system ATP-binding protein [Noviherbaspirillum suwonense]